MRSILLVVIGAVCILVLHACNDEESLPMGTLPPATACPPVLSVPGDFDTLWNDSAVLTWSYSPGSCVQPESYTVYLGATPQPEDFLAIATTDKKITVRDLVMDTIYYWYVVSHCPYLDGTSEVRCFITDTERPGLAYNPSPANGAVDIEYGDDLFWSYYNPGAENFTFDVYFGAAPQAPLASGVTDTTYDPGTLIPGQTYQWWINSISADNDTVPGPHWSFTAKQAPPVFVMLELDKAVYMIPGSTFFVEVYRARFDSLTALIQPTTPLQAGGVKLEELATAYTVDLPWLSDLKLYQKYEGNTPIISENAEFLFKVASSSTVPAMNITVKFVECMPSILTPLPTSVVSMSGFDVTWNPTTCDGNVFLTILKNDDSTGVWVETENDGHYTFTTDDLSPLSMAGAYNIALIRQNEGNIVSDACSSESVWRCRSISVAGFVTIL